jgi:hypothetical protein
VLAYPELHAVLGRPDGERKAVQAAVRETGKRMLATEKRCLVPVRGVGYRIVLPSEHVYVGKDRESRGVRQFRRAVSVYKGTPLDELTDAQRTLHLNTAMLAQAALAAFQEQDRMKSDWQRIRDVFRAPGPGGRA